MQYAALIVFFYTLIFLFVLFDVHQTFYVFEIFYFMVSSFVSFLHVSSGGGRLFIMDM